ncbi:MAG: tRNA (N(6)-L-threonylcarbamoyladenosine(37)-C(2))-methylthiotransferase MtaB, partial [Oscillospiraceae bacterium]|nr:tRNA (N(6)-L-threonylcarbamoyladenosine(37)-C(2))-methylthiotransferase MtaB [Oscillospiraceae bacterium]
PVLFERERETAFHNGHTPDFTPVKIPAEPDKKSLRKLIFYVRIEKSNSACCFGHMVPDDNANHANSQQKE